MGIQAFYVHTASVETFQGAGANGDVYDPAVSVPCFMDFDANLSLTAQSEQDTSGTRLFCDLSYAPVFTPGSAVTANGIVAQVVSSNRHDSGPLGLPDHLEVVLR